MNAVKALTEYALGKGLIEECEYIWAMNTIIDVIGADDIPDIEDHETEKKTTDSR